jgi:hypothetical protein
VSGGRLGFPIRSGKEKEPPWRRLFIFECSHGSAGNALPTHQTKTSEAGHEKGHHARFRHCGHHSLKAVIARRFMAFDAKIPGRNTPVAASVAAATSRLVTGCSPESKQI